MFIIHVMYAKMCDSVHEMQKIKKNRISFKLTYSCKSTTVIVICNNIRLFN